MRQFLKVLSFAAVVAAPSISGASTQLITNGGFENGLSDWSCQYATGCLKGSDYSWKAPFIHNGNDSFWGYEQQGYGILSQSFATQIGTSYDLSFWSRTSKVKPGNALEYSAGDLGPVSVKGTGAFLQTTDSFVANSTQTVLSFLFRTKKGSGFWSIDDVSVTASAIQPQSLAKVAANDLAPVPLPAAMPLLAAGLGGLGLMRLRRARRG